MAYNKETGMYEGFIYKIYNDINNIFYIGRTLRTVEKRWKEHCNYSKTHNTDIYKAIRDYGVEHFNISIIETKISKTRDESEKLCIDREQYWIKYYRDNGYIIYNMTDGGYDYNSLKYPEKQVIQYDLFCNEINRFKSIADASEHTGINHSDISTCCSKNGKIFRTDNYIWRYVDEPLTDEEISDLKNRYKGVCKYDFEGNLLDVFYRPIDAATSIDNKRAKTICSNITACMIGKVKSAYGYIWRYYSDSFDKYPLPKRIRKVKQFSFNGDLIGIYNDCRDASRKTGIDDSTINLCCLKKLQYSGGYIWCYEGDTPDFDIVFKEKSVDRYSLDGAYIDSYNSIKEASEILRINNTSIGYACADRNKTAGGYIWRFHNDPIETYKFDFIKGGDNVA